ncbi:hypothetical protein LV779_07475 [Streptomyces thinghirensis]|nr:hypothetical protein [Streptomyces thinghirensis]
MRLRELVVGAACAAALRAAARLGVADALGDTPMTVEDLAASVKTEPRPLRRLLRALTCYGVFAERKDGTFTHTDMSLLLREDDPHSLRYITLWCTEPWTWDAWPQLDEAVRTGHNVVEGLYGKEFFTYLNEDAPRVGRGLQPRHDHLQPAVGPGRRGAPRPVGEHVGRGHRRRPGGTWWRAC